MKFNFRTDNQGELIELAETLATANGHLQRELAELRADLARLRRSRKLAAMRGDRRMIERAAADARFLGALHLAGLNTTRRAKENHGLSRWRHESAVGILRLGGVYGRRGWLTTNPADVHAGIEAGLSAAIRNPDRWKGRLPQNRTVGRQMSKMG